MNGNIFYSDFTSDQEKEICCEKRITHLFFRWFQTFFFSSENTLLFLIKLFQILSHWSGSIEYTIDTGTVFRSAIEDWNMFYVKCQWFSLKMNFNGIFWRTFRITKCLLRCVPLNHYSIPLLFLLIFHLNFVDNMWIIGKFCLSLIVLKPLPALVSCFISDIIVSQYVSYLHIPVQYLPFDSWEPFIQ